MLSKLIKKEFALSMHPFTPVSLLLAAMVLIPNYPYTVVFFYTTLSLFFINLSGRENNDVVYSLTLPIAKSDVVRARYAFTVILEFATLAFTLLVSELKGTFMFTENAAGLDANLALAGAGLIIYGVFNMVFYGAYYKDVNKVGRAFVIASIATFVIVGIVEATSHFVPFMMALDTPDPVNFTEKAIFFAAGAVVFLILTGVSYKASVRNFEKQDL